VNVIWQPEVNEVVLRSFLRCKSPPEIFNVTGPETVPIRWLANRFAERFGKEPTFEGREAETALLSNASRAHAEFGYPAVPLRRMIDLVTTWLEGGGETIDKPTHFQTRSGNF
jgi:nucleoside-diphosphate-sugar epimerase